MTVTKEHLARYGWTEIRSWAQANQLVRRELKQWRAAKQRGEEWRISMELILDIKPGNFYKFISASFSKGKVLILWRVGNASGYAKD